MIEFDHLRRTYGEKVAVDDVNLVVPAGELFAFLGPNGAGKTTSIKMMVGLLRPTSGSVRVCGVDVALKHREASRLLGYVPDEPYLYDKLTGREFLEFVAGMHGMATPVVEQRIAEVTEGFDLADFLDDLTESYSHGMKQRVVFASSVLHEPRVLVIDEPMVGLDPRTTRTVKDLLRTLVARGVTVFMSTHTLTVAEEIADRIAIIDHGRLRAVGTLPELREQMAARDSSLEQLFLGLTAGGQVVADETVPSRQSP